ncbi:SLC5/6 family protein [Paenibacillus hexagrammi]|uniref:Spore germination protein KB n=1 Tax=Paenibacillus hexagrammi TaxID=2908839 RepID=A0ABY3SCT2_9BACL|nr:hypothetical protein [Paenibacillus sp. YPD9-1]UJF31290.1 hypothetical protein L0M14_15600 [Paenibacillus sp. YPD9-1]
MKWLKEESIYYPFLLFVVMLGLSVTRAPSLVILGIGRNSIWIFIPCLLSVWLGIWMHQVIARSGSVSLIDASHQVGGVFLSRSLYACFAVLFTGGTVYFTYLSGDFLSKTLLFGNLRAYVLLETVLATGIALLPLKTHARYAHIMMIFVVPFFLFISLAPLLHLRWNWVTPLFTRQEWNSPIHAFTSAMLVYLPLAAISLIHDKRRTIHGLSLGILSLIIAIITTYFMIIGIATFGIKRAGEIIYLTYSVVNTARIENFVLERIVFIWILYWKYMQFIGSAFLLRCASRAVAGVIGVRINAFIIIPMGLLIAIVEWVSASPFLAKSLSVPLGFMTFGFLAILPVCVVLGMKIRRKLP